jgi:hypothetical protein
MVALVALTFALPQTASALEAGFAQTPSTTKPYYACPEGPCGAIIDPAPAKTASGYELPVGGPLLEGSGELGGYSPSDLQSAYKIPTTGGTGQTVAIVDAYGDTTAESDLIKYREKYKLSECTKASGCFKKVNEKGEEANYPAANAGWGLETSLDLDMVSAACPNCHILLVEASGELPPETGASVEEAVKLSATEVSNSYGYPENYEPWCGKTGCAPYASDYSHPGIPILASSGDSGYRDAGLGASFPAAAPGVIAVGGTSLNKAANTRGWSEKTWFDTGSGCSEFESKPAWQTDAGCAKKTANDVSSDAACETPVSVYSTPNAGGWANVCGTSASSPLVAGLEAHSTSTVRSLGAEAFWKAGPTGAFFDVTEGSNGSCATEVKYLCTAQVGYDGPTGWGTPNGIIEVHATPITITEAATSLTESGATLNGSVNPNGHETKYYFEYGTTTSYGTKTAEVGIGSGTTALKETKAITSLASNTTYHFRITATNSEGTSHGEDKTFKTSAHIAAWALQSTAKPPESIGSDLYGVTCTSTTNCVSVGKVNTSGKTLAEQWNGTEWKVQSTPNPTGYFGLKGGNLRGASCSSSTACTAVGYYRNESGIEVSLAERWNGTEWAIQEMPNPIAANAYSNPYSVSCISSTFCMASGTYEHLEESTAKLYPFTELWNGSEWKVQEPPIPSGAKHTTILSGVSCVSSTFCIANGSYVNSSGTTVPLAEKWNGTEWTIQTTSSPASATYSGTTRVTCRSTTECDLVGAYATSAHPQVMPYAERWNGTEWKVQETPLPSGAKAGTLAEVSCASATECIAVGDYQSSGGVLLPLAERWNGTEWKTQEPPNPSGAEKAVLFGISCSGVEICTAVGNLTPPSGSENEQVSFAERYS